MAKRHLTPEILPDSKRQHTSGLLHRPPDRSHSAFQRLFYDELILVIFSYLSWTDLCTIQPTNRNWSRLSLDNQLWKSLYINEYGRTRLRGVRGFAVRGDGKEVRPLPGRAKADPEIRDWKWMFRISSNWRTGRCAVEQLSGESRLSTLPLSSLGPIQDGTSPGLGPHVILAGDMAIFTTLQTSSEPRLTLSSPSFGMSHLLCTSVRSRNTTSITALALDQSRPPNDNHTRVASFLATGEFTIFSINHAVPSTSSPVLKYVPSSITTRNSPIIQAAYHHPLLITLSESFRLSLYDLSDDKVSHTQTLSSFTSYPPSSLVLSCPSATAYKLVLAYAIPVYPAHWSVGATELMISPSPVMSVSSTRTTKAFDIPPGWVDEQKMQAVREQWSRKVSRVADTQTDGKWVVLAPGGSLSTPSPGPATSPESSSLAVAPSSQSPSSLQLYRLYLPASTSLSSVPKLTFVRTLHGHMGPISSLALADGRCVSLGVNGSIWVWDLEGGTGAQVSASCVEAQIPLNGLNVKGSIAFDERRIIVADVGGVMMRRFDV